MGSVFGIVSEEEHGYTVEAKHPNYEVRAYAAGSMIEADKNGFMKLAGYIGVPAPRPRLFSSSNQPTRG